MAYPSVSTIPFEAPSYKNTTRVYKKVYTLDDVNQVCDNTVTADEFYAAQYSGTYDLFDQTKNHIRLLFHMSTEEALLIPGATPADSAQNGKNVA